MTPIPAPGRTPAAPSVTVVVPTRNSGRTLRACLASLRQQTYEPQDIVVVDNQSTDATVAIARELADTVAQFGPERSAQRNEGARLGRGDVVLFIDSDMVLEPHVLRQVAEVLQSDPTVGAVTIPERSFGEGFLAGCRALEKSLYVGDDSVEAPRAFRREVLDVVGGWNEELTAAEDWDLADRVRAAGVAVARVSAWIWHDEGRLQLRGTFGKKRYYGQWLGSYLEAHPEGRSRLVRSSLFQRPGELARHPVRTAGLLTLKSVEAAGMAAGVRNSRRQSPSHTVPVAVATA